MSDEPRGKPCPRCGSPLVALRSMNRRQCVGCGRMFEWLLDEGQRPLIGSNRQDRSAIPSGTVIKMEQGQEIEVSDALAKLVDSIVLEVVKMAVDRYKTEGEE